MLDVNMRPEQVKVQSTEEEVCDEGGKGGTGRREEGVGDT
jgi:hypothetical protein